MNITRDNYEAWFLDYLEGNLEEGRIDEFLEFLKQNPDLKEELRLFEPITIEKSDLEFPGKNRLYKEPIDFQKPFDPEEDYDEAAVAFLEGDMDDAQRQRFIEFTGSHPGKQKELEIFRLTFLKPDTSVHFGAKQKLYHQPAGKVILMWSQRVAAVMVLALGTYAILNIPWEGGNRENIIAVTPGNETQPDISGNLSRADGQPASTGTEKQSAGRTAGTAFVSADQAGTLTAPSNLTAQATQISKAVRNIAAPAPPSSLPSGKEPSLNRLPVEMPGIIPAKSGEVAAATVELALAAMEMSMPEIQDEESEVDGINISGWVKKKAGLSGFTFQSLVKGGLNLAANITRDKINYHSNSAGEITALTLETALLGLSIPVGTNE